MSSNNGENKPKKYYFRGEVLNWILFNFTGIFALSLNFSYDVQ